jgi:hypothetical protein
MERKFKIENRNRKKMQFCVLTMFALLVSSTIIAQETRFGISSNEVLINENGNSAGVAPVKISTSVLNSNMNFILWFMGTKEDVSTTISIDSYYSKKSILTSGREPNHLLMKTLLKKAINIKSC